jgi:hypothetical protein
MQEAKVLMIEVADWAMIDSMMRKYPGEFAPSDHDAVLDFDMDKPVSLPLSTAKKMKNIAVQAERLWSHEQGMINAEC